MEHAPASCQSHRTAIFFRQIIPVLVCCSHRITGLKLAAEREVNLPYDVTRVDAVLASRFAWAQVFAGSGRERELWPRLLITYSCGLVILELKPGEYIHLPVPAADDWLRRPASSGRSASFIALAIFPESKYRMHRRWFTPQLPRHVSMLSRKFCCEPGARNSRSSG